MISPPRSTPAGTRLESDRLAPVPESEKLRGEIAELRRELADTRRQQQAKQGGPSLLGLGIAFLIGVSLGDD